MAAITVRAAGATVLRYASSSAGRQVAKNGIKYVVETMSGSNAAKLAERNFNRKAEEATKRAVEKSALSSN